MQYSSKKAVIQVFINSFLYVTSQLHATPQAFLRKLMSNHVEMLMFVTVFSA